MVGAVPSPFNPTDAISIDAIYIRHDLAGSAECDSAWVDKKMQQIALQQSLMLRCEFMATTMMYRKEQLVWLDETGFHNCTYMRRHGYTIWEDTSRYHRLLSLSWYQSFAIAALSTDGLVAMELMNGTTDANTFFDFIRENHIPYESFWWFKSQVNHNFR